MGGLKRRKKAWHLIQAFSLTGNIISKYGLFLPKIQVSPYLFS
jgi:hypothetical protein